MRRPYICILIREAKSCINKLNKLFTMKKLALFFALFTFVSIVATAQPQLTWRFANVEVINAGAQLQFDVEVMADAPGSFHRDLQVYFDYNTAGFGSDIVANGKVTVTPLALMNTHYVVVNTADNTSSKFAVITEASNEMTDMGGAAAFNEVPTTFTGLLQFTIDIASNTEMAGIAFDQALMDGGQYYQSTSAIAPVKYASPSVYNNDILTDKLSTLYGTITYADAGSTPLNNCTVTINSGGPVGTANTDVNGFYNYMGLNDGAYTLTTTSTLPYTYVTDVGDVNVVIDHIVGSPLTGVFFLAGDVDGSTLIDVTDLNLMIDNIVGAVVGYPIPNWVFETQNVTVAGSSATQDYQGLQASDTDGSW